MRLELVRQPLTVHLDAAVRLDSVDFGPKFCGAGNCTSSCDAVAECGQYPPSNSTNCPLNVCCSQYG
jgi:hypothetical protein